MEKRLKEAEEAGEQQTAALTPEVVDAEQIAAVVSRWTGVPVEKMLEGEREKLLSDGGPAAQAAWSARTRRWSPSPTPSAARARA